MAEIKGRYRSSPDTLQDKQWSDIRIDSSGALVTVSGATGSSANQVQGNIADNVADAGNAVKMGAIVAPASLPANSGSTRTSLYATTGGVLLVGLTGNVVTAADAQANTGIIAPGSSGGSTNAGTQRTGLLTASMLFNGSSWDRQRGDTSGAYVVPPLASQWSYAAAASGIVNTTTAVTVKTAAGAGVRNYVSSIDLSWDALTNVTEFAIRDGASGTVLYRHKIVNTLAGRHSHEFSVPLKGTANTLLEIVTLSASGAGGVYANLQGFTGV